MTQETQCPQCGEDASEYVFQTFDSSGPSVWIHADGTTNCPYQSFKNYETFLVKACFIDNEQPNQERAYALARHAISMNPKEGFSEPWMLLSEYLKEWILDLIDEKMPEGSSIVKDLTTAALSQVNFDEIAKSLMGDLREDSKVGA